MTVRKVAAVLPSSKAAADGTTSRQRRTTLAAIAAEAGVSLPTVSKVVNGRRDVAPATRALVERLLDERHYTRVGQHRNRRSGLVDLVFNDLDSPWAVEILRGAEEWGFEHETGVAVSAVRHGDVRPASWTTGLASHDTDGVILVISDVTPSQLEQLHRADIPLVVVDPVNPPPPDLPSVGATNWAGGLTATEHLLGLGHRRIGMIAGPGDYLCSRARTDGYRSALDRAGIAFDPELVRNGDFRHEGGFIRGGELLDLADPPIGHLRGQRPAGLRSLRGRTPPWPADTAGPRGGRVRRPAGRPLGLAAAHHRAPAARRDGPGRCADARRPDRRPARCAPPGSSCPPS